MSGYGESASTFVRSSRDARPLASPCTRRALALVIGALHVSSISYAQQPDAPKDAPKSAEAKDAEQHFGRARQLYDEGDFALALVEFRRAYDLSPNYRVLYNIAQVNIQLFNYAAARVAMEKYLQDGGGEISAARKSQAEADLKMLKERTAYLQIVSVPGGEVTIDELPVGKAPFEEPLLVNAGQRKIVVARAGYVSQTRMVTLAGGDRTDVRFELVAVPNEKNVIVVPTTTHKNYTPAVLGWIGTGALAIGAGIVGGLYLSKESELDDLSNPATRVTPQGRQDAIASADRLAVIADILGLATVVGGLASLYFTLRPPTTTTAATTTTGKVRIVPGGLAGTF
jgi:hypothetical protein